MRKTAEDFYPKNDRNTNRTDDIKSVKYHVNTFNQVSPIVIIKKNNKYIKLDGVHRLVAAKIRKSKIRVLILSTK
jgi:ParB-like chromosome segregation protein Spo0J